MKALAIALALVALPALAEKSKEDRRTEIAREMVEAAETLGHGMAMKCTARGAYCNEEATLCAATYSCERLKFVLVWVFRDEEWELVPCPLLGGDAT